MQLSPQSKTRPIDLSTNRNRLTDLANKLTVASGEGWGEGTVRELGMDMSTQLHLKWITNIVLLHSTGNSAQRNAQPGREGRVEESGYVYMSG